MNIRKEKALFLGVLRRFNNFFAPWDLEIYSNNGKHFDTEGEYYEYIKRLKGEKLKQEINRGLACIRTRRHEEEDTNFNIYN